MSGWILTAVLLGGRVCFGFLGDARVAKEPTVAPIGVETGPTEIPANLAETHKALILLNDVPGFHRIEVRPVEGGRFADLQDWIQSRDGRLEAFALLGLGHDGASLKGVRAIVPAPDFETAMETIKGLKVAMRRFRTGGAR